MSMTVKSVGESVSLPITLNEVLWMSATLVIGAITMSHLWQSNKRIGVVFLVAKLIILVLAVWTRLKTDAALQLLGHPKSGLTTQFSLYLVSMLSDVAILFAS